MDEIRDELGLGSDRELGVRVEHQPKERRPRAPDADDEGRRRNVSVTLPL